MPLSTLRVMVMTVGELDFSDFVDLYKNHNPYNPFPAVAFTFLFLCLVLLSVGLMNLLVRRHPVHVTINKGTIIYGRNKRLEKMHFTNKSINLAQGLGDQKRQMTEGREWRSQTLLHGARSSCV